MFFAYFYSVDNDFLHKINLELLKKETGLSIEGIGELSQMKNPKGVYNWSKDKANNGTRPSYNAIVRLLENGATVETLFGVDYVRKKPVEPSPPPHVLNDPEFKESLEDLMVDILKKKGVL